jgi:hypothetical protein
MYLILDRGAMIGLEHRQALFPNRIAYLDRQCRHCRVAIVVHLQCGVVDRVLDLWILRGWGGLDAFESLAL